MGFRPLSDGDHEGKRGLGGFLRSLIPGVPWREAASSTEELRLEIPASEDVRIHNPNGRTRIVGEERDDIAVHIERKVRAESTESAERVLSQIELNVEQGELLQLEVDAPRNWSHHAHAHIELRMPSRCRASVMSANGKICAEGLRGGLRARSSNGAICVNDLEGLVEIETSNAKVCCSCTCGTLRARSSNGKIELGEHRGSIDAVTSNGLIRASVDELGDEGVMLATSNGRIVLELPKQVDADVDVRVENGLIRCARELIAKGRDRAGRLRGRLGAGGTPIKLRTSNGTISLR